MNNNTYEYLAKFKSLYSNFNGKIYLKEKREKIEPTFFNFDIEDEYFDEYFIAEKSFSSNSDLIKILKELNLEYNSSLTIQENLQFLKEKNKIVNYHIFPILEDDEYVIGYKIFFGGNHIFYTNKKRVILIKKED